MARIAGRLPLPPLTGEGAWGLYDQGLISATNFATMLLLARTMSASAFGAFSLVYAGLLFANSFQASLITQPHNVLGTGRDGVDYARYTTASAIGQVALATVAGALTLLLAIGARFVSPGIVALLVALIGAVVAWQLQEFVRRVLYTEGRLRDAFANDLIAYGGQFLLVVALWRAGHLSGVAALTALAATSALAAAFGAWQLRAGFVSGFDLGVLRENWQFGKWLVAGELIGYWLSEQLYVYLTALLIGTAQAGALKAVVLIFGPVRILVTALSTTLPIRFARALKADDGPRFRAQLRVLYRLIGILLGGYCLLVAIFAGPILRFVYGATYADRTPVLVLYTVYTFLMYAAITLATPLRATQQTRYIFVTYLCAGLSSITLGWAFIRLFGIEGAVIGMILSASIMFARFALAHKHGLRAVQGSSIATVGARE